MIPKLHIPVVPEQPGTAQLGGDLFRRLQALILQVSGIQLADSKRTMVATRLARRLRALELDSYEQYFTLLQKPDNPELYEFIDAVTTNLTYFFRENHHFQMLADTVAPKLADKAGSSTPVRIWSAGCSSGQEAYSIAIQLVEAGLHRVRPIRILCTDIHSQMVRQTAAGIYTESELRGLSMERRQRFFRKFDNQRVQADQELRSMLICQRSNLFDDWPFRPGVDVVFCRNTLIYFSPEKQHELIRRLANYQNTGSYLFIGHSESMRECEDVYRRAGNTVYERI